MAKKVVMRIFNETSKAATLEDLAMGALA